MSSPNPEYLNKHTLRRVQVLDSITHRKDKYSSTILKKLDGYVYAATNDLFPSLIKIGCTLNEDPIIRLNFIANKTELSSNFKIIAIIKSKDAFSLKSQIHQYFDIYRYSGENGSEFFEASIVSVQRYFSDYVRNRSSKRDKNLPFQQNYAWRNDMGIDNNNIPIIKSTLGDWINPIIIKDAILKPSLDKVVPIKSKTLTYKDKLLLQFSSVNATAQANTASSISNQENEASSITNTTISDISTIDSSVYSQEEDNQQENLPVKSRKRRNKLKMEKGLSTTRIVDNGIFVVILFNGLHVSVGSCLRNSHSQIIFPDVY